MSFRIIVRPGWLWLAVWCCAGFGANPLAAQSTNAAHLFTTNRLNTPHFWRAVEASNGPVTVLAFGDSMSEPGRSIQRELFGRLQSKLGKSGYSLLAYWQFGGGAELVFTSTNWWATHGALPAGGIIYWNPFENLPSDRLGVYWMAGPLGGDFNVSVSTNFQAWSSPLLTLDGYAPELTARYANLSLPQSYYRLRVEGVSGTNTILGPEYKDTRVAGIHVAYLARAGANLNQILASSTNALHPVLSALNPQLVVYHMKELGDIGEVNFSNRLHRLEALWRACLTGGDVVYLGTPYDYRDQVGEYTGRENVILREAALRDGRAYLDCMTPCVSYDAMTNNGYFNFATDVHPNQKCNQFLTDVIWAQLGFFALRTDRQLAVTLASGSVALGWVSAGHLQYDLQASADLTNWTTIHAVAGTGGPLGFTNTTGVGSNQFYRLSLSPD